MGRGGRPAGIRAHALGDLGEAPQRAAGGALGRHDDLRQQPLQRDVHLVLGEPVVQQGRLRADLPRGEQIDDERERRRQAQRDGAAATQPGVSEGAVPLGHEPAQLSPADRGAEVQAHVARGARQQHFVNPLGC